MTQEDLRDRLRHWALGSSCRLCVLFGSTATGRPGWRGDVDVAASFTELPEPITRLEMIGRLQEALAREDVDLVFLHDRTDPVLRFEIFRTGTPVFEEEEGLFVRREGARADAVRGRPPLPEGASREAATGGRPRAFATIRTKWSGFSSCWSRWPRTSSPISWPNGGPPLPRTEKCSRRGGRRELVPVELAGRLADAAGLRNILVHMYEDIDYGIVAASIGRALEDFNEFLRIFQERLEESSGEGSGRG